MKLQTLCMLSNLICLSVGSVTTMKFMKIILDCAGCLIPRQIHCFKLLIIKDLLIQCNLPLALCRGQEYDGAANMQGRRTGVATGIKNEQPAALSVHCCAHSLNLCLQDARRRLVCLSDALGICRGIVDLIRLSPKRLHLFSSNLQASNSDVGLKPLCPTMVQSNYNFTHVLYLKRASVWTEK